MISGELPQLAARISRLLLHQQRLSAVAGAGAGAPQWSAALPTFPPGHQPQGSVPPAPPCTAAPAQPRPHASHTILRCHASPHHHHNHQLRRSFFGSSSPSPQSDEDARKDAEAMLNLMAKSPRMQQMMMRMLPAAAQNPETMQQILNDPGMKEKLVQMLAKQKIRIPSHILSSMSHTHMDATFERAAKMGVNPDDLFGKLMSQPLLLKKMQDPRIMGIFMDLSQNPQNAYKYKDDKEAMEVIQEVRAALASSAQQGPASSGATTATTASLPLQEPTTAAPTAGPATTPTTADVSAATAVPPPPGTPPFTPAPGSAAAAGPVPGLGAGSWAGLGGKNPADLMSLMMSDAELMKRMQNPKVQKALVEISKSPWKTVKYVLDREVMEVFSALNNLMRGKDPWTGKAKGSAK